MATMLDSFHSNLSSDQVKQSLARPTNKMLLIKHDSRDSAEGKLSVMRPNLSGDQWDRQQVVENTFKIDKCQFAAITTLQHLSGKDEKTGTRYYTDCSENGYFNIRNSDGNSLGIYTSKEAYDSNLPTRVAYRVFGLLRSINGKAPQTAIPELKEDFGDDLIPVVFDMNFTKRKALQQVAEQSGLESYDAGNFVSIEGGIHNDCINETNNGINYLPKFECEALTEKANKTMSEKASEFLDLLNDFMSKIRSQDEMYRSLSVNGYDKRPGLVEKLNAMEITDNESLDKFLEKAQAEGKDSWKALNDRLNQAVDQAANKVDAFAQNRNTLKEAMQGSSSASSVADTEIEVSDEELPF